MRGLRPKRWTTAAALLVVALLAACGGGGKGNAPTQPPATATTPAELTAPQILAKASARLAATQTMKFSLAITGQTFVDTNNQIQLLDASGSLVRPDEVYTEFRIKVGNTVTVSMKLITIGDKHWSTDLITGKWGAAPEEFGYNPSILFDNKEGIGPVMDDVTDGQKLANEPIQGHDAYHIQASVQQSIIGPLTSESMEGDDVGVDLWIDSQTFNLLQVKLTESKSVTDHQPAVWILSLTDQDSKISIAAPDAPYSVSSPEASPAASPAASPRQRVSRSRRLNALNGVISANQSRRAAGRCGRRWRRSFLARSI